MERVLPVFPDEGDPGVNDVLSSGEFLKELPRLIEVFRFSEYLTVQNDDSVRTYYDPLLEGSLVNLNGLTEGYVFDDFTVILSLYLLLRPLRYDLEIYSEPFHEVLPSRR